MADPQIIFYHYAYSPYARRIQWYLALRGLPFSECLQPPVMPRPDIARLGVAHRRIPVLSIGRDVYVDTRLMFQKLEELYPSKPRLAAGATEGAAPETKALDRLLDILSVDTIFIHASKLIPQDLPLLKDPVFLKDRAEFFGGAGGSPADGGPSPAAKPSPSLRRAESLAEIRGAAALLETTLLADGRDWLLKTPSPSLADIEAIWPFHWLAGMPGAFLDGSGAKEPALDAKQFPRLFAWIARFDGAVKAARKAGSKAARLTGEQAATAILAAPFNEESGSVPSSLGGNCPVARAGGFQPGQRVVIWPTDTGATGKDVGKLIKIDGDEVVLAIEKDGAETVHLHAPRRGFVVRPAKEGDSAKL